MTNIPTLHVMDHPLIRHSISRLRRKETTTFQFRQFVAVISFLIGYEATRTFSLKMTEIETPLQKMQAPVLETPVCLVPILRAGLGMVSALQLLLPYSSTGHIGLCRNEETLQPMEYLCKLPKNISEQMVLLLDPMLATGGSSIHAVNLLKKHGAKKIIMLNIIGSPEGAEAFTKAHPDVEVFLGCMDERLNDHGYILPGLGDAGDRLFGTM